MSIEDELGAIEGAAKRLLHIGQQQPAPVPTFTARQQSQSQPEVRMSLGTEFHRWATVAETFGEDALAVLEAVAANPEAKMLVIAASRLAGLPVAPGTIGTAVSSLQAIESAWHTAQQAVQQANQDARAAQKPADGTGAQQAAQARTAPAVV